jgi:hypothetical protein
MPYRTPKHFERQAAAERVRAQREADKEQGRTPVEPTLMEVLEHLRWGRAGSADVVARALSCDLELTRSVLESAVSSGYVEVEAPQQEPAVEAPQKEPAVEAPQNEPDGGGTEMPPPPMYALTPAGQAVVDDYDSDAWSDTPGVL